MKIKSKSAYVLVLAACILCMKVQPAYADSSAFTSPNLQQQEQQISGKILDKNGQAIPGVTIVDKANSGIWAVTDLDGNFSISGKSGATYVLSCIGFKTIELSAAALVCSN